MTTILDIGERVLKFEPPDVSDEDHAWQHQPALLGDGDDIVVSGDFLTDPFFLSISYRLEWLMPLQATKSFNYLIWRWSDLTIDHAMIYIAAAKFFATKHNLVRLCSSDFLSYRQGAKLSDEALASVSVAEVAYLNNPASWSM